MARSFVPLQIVPASILTYGLLARIFLRSAKRCSLQAKVKAISAGHAVITTLLVLFALSKSPWRFPNAPSRGREPRYAADGNLDDTGNPLLQERSAFANAIAAWETGYLLYDTWAMIHHVQMDSSQRGFMESAAAVARRQPALLGHHVVLSSAFLYLQYYIYLGRERGIWIVIAFLLMNTSNPLMHARWWARRQGRPSMCLDAAFAALFAVSRFWTVAWILRHYGACHGLGPWEVYKKLRVPCQVGTGALVGLNALWWMRLVDGITRRRKSSR